MLRIFVSPCYNCNMRGGAFSLQASSIVFQWTRNGDKEEESLEKERIWVSWKWWWRKRCWGVLPDAGAGWGGGFAVGPMLRILKGFQRNGASLFFGPQTLGWGEELEVNTFLLFSSSWTCLTIRGSIIDSTQEGAGKKRVKWESWVGHLWGSGVILTICRSKGKKDRGEEAPVALWVEEISGYRSDGPHTPADLPLWNHLRAQFVADFGC